MSQNINPRYMHVAGAALIALAQGSTGTDASALEHVQNKLTVVPYYWNPATLDYEVARQVSTGGGGSTAVDASLTSAGSTRLVGQFTVANPTTSVDATLSSAGSTRIVGKFELSPTTPGSSNDYLWVRALSAGSGSTEVDANLTSIGSTRLVGQFTLANPTTAVDATLTSIGSTRLVGQVTLTNPTTLVDQGGPAASSANAWWVRTVSTQGGAGSTSRSGWRFAVHDLMGVETKGISKNLLTVSRLWHNPQIRVSVDDVGISVSTMLPDFLEALLHELAIPAQERDAAREKLFEAAERVCTGIKAETGKVM